MVDGPEKYETVRACLAPRCDTHAVAEAEEEGKKLTKRRKVEEIPHATDDEKELIAADAEAEKERKAGASKEREKRELVLDACSEGYGKPVAEVVLPTHSL